MKLYRGTVAQVANQAITDYTRRQFGPRPPAGANHQQKRAFREGQRFDRWQHKQAQGLGYRMPHERG